MIRHSRQRGCPHLIGRARDRGTSMMSSPFFKFLLANTPRGHVWQARPTTAPGCRVGVAAAVAMNAPRTAAGGSTHNGRCVTQRAHQFRPPAHSPLEQCVRLWVGRQDAARAPHQAPCCQQCCQGTQQQRHPAGVRGAAVAARACALFGATPLLRGASHGAMLDFQNLQVAMRCAQHVQGSDGRRRSSGGRNAGSRLRPSACTAIGAHHTLD